MSLIDDLTELLATIEGHTGVYARRLDDPEPAAQLHADRSFTLASVVKLPMLIHLLGKVEAGDLDLSARIAQTEADRVPGSGLLQTFDPGLQPTLHDLLRLMMIISDNQATDAVLALSSKEAVEAEIQARGYASFFMPHSVREVVYSLTDLSLDAGYDEALAQFRSPDFAPPADPPGASAERGNRATPRDLAGMLTDLQAGRLLGPAMTATGMAILEACQTNSRIPYDLPPGTVVAHKTGTLGGRTNDAGIVFGPKGPYVVVLMNHGESDERKASRTLAAVSRRLYDHFAEG